jgi:hypothetical protein
MSLILQYFYERPPLTKGANIVCFLLPLFEITATGQKLACCRQARCQMKHNNTTLKAFKLISNLNNQSESKNKT